MIISFANQKGGVGKTTSAVNIAAAIAAMNKKVLLVDLDPQGNASTGVGFMDRSELNSTYHILTENLSVTDAILHTEFKNLDIVPATVDLAAAELEIKDVANRERILKAALSVVAEQYDYIFIDCAPALGLLTINALVASDGVIIPCPCEFYALEGLVQLTNTIDIIKDYHNPKLKIIGVLVTMYNSRLNLTQSIMRDLREHFGNLIFKNIIVRNVRLAEAPSYGTPVIYLDKFSKGSLSYIEVSKEIVERVEHNN